MSGKTVSHYLIQEEIGKGTFGVVYKALDVRLGHTVAIKILLPRWLEDSDRVRRFRQEAQAASCVNHPNVVAIHGIGHEGRVLYIVMEFVAGKTLREMLTGGALEANDALRYTVQIADALEAVHREGVVHRDLKPSNIMVNHQGVVKLLDFGLAKLAERVVSAQPAEQAPTLTAEPFTPPGTILGTIRYMSPEQLKGQRVDCRSDIFSLGAVLYEMLSGRPAFAGDSDAALVAAVLRDAPRDLPSSVPGSLRTIVGRCLCKAAVGRFQTAAELQKALAEIRLAGEELRPQPIAGWPGWASRDRWQAAVASCYDSGGLKVTLAHDAASEPLRNEFTFLGENIERTWARRLFICDQRGSRMGFLHLRRTVPDPPDVYLFEGYLATPGRLSDFHIISSQTVYHLYGIEPSEPRVSGFAVPHKEYAGFCSQASCQMALMNLLPAGAVCLGAFDITRLGLQCADRKRLSGFNRVGLTAPQMRDVLASPLSGVNGHLEILSASDDIICDLLAGYVLSDCPVILCVPTSAWEECVRPQLEERGCPMPPSGGGSDDGPVSRHAVVVVGCQRRGNGAEQEFVIHDSRTSPFLRVAGHALARVAKGWCGDDKVRWVAAVPRAVVRGGYAIWEELYSAYVKPLGPLVAGGYRIVPQLCQRDQIVSRYIVGARRFDVSWSTLADLERSLARRCGDYVWAVEVMPQGSPEPLATHFFDASIRARESHVGKLSRNELVLWRKPAGADTWKLRTQ